MKPSNAQPSMSADVERRPGLWLTTIPSVRTGGVVVRYPKSVRYMDSI